MEAWLTNLFERNRLRYVLASAAVPVGAVLFVAVPLLLLFPAHYEGLSLGRYLATIAIADGIALSVVGIAALTVRDGLRVVLAWSRDPTSGDPASVRYWMFDGPGRAVTTCFLIGVLVVPLFVSVLLPRGRVTAVDWLELAIGSTGAMFTALLNAWFTLELMLGPVRAVLGSLAGEGHRRPSLVARLAVFVPACLWLGQVGLGYLLTTRAKAGQGHLMLVYGLATANSLIFVAVLAPLLTSGVLHPIRSLTRAARAVTAGRLDTRVKVTTADELGELAQSFNQMLDELQQSRARIVAAADASRRKVERDLHDGAQQRLVLLALKASMLEREHGSTPLVAEIRAEIQLALTELRDLAHGLYPQVLESDGLPGALQEAASGAPIPTTVDCDGAGRYDPELEAAVYFCCLEALQNAAKHAGDGACASVRLAQREAVLQFEVTDDGQGFDPDGTGASAGLQNMRDRIGALGGELRIESVQGSGTTITGAVPVPTALAASAPSTPAPASRRTP